MNNERFFHIMKYPADITPADRKSLYDVINVFPNFQTAHMLLLYNLYNTDPETFDQQLRVSAIFVSDRKILFNFLHDIKEDSAQSASIVDRHAAKEDHFTADSKPELLEFEDVLLSEDESARIVDFGIDSGESETSDNGNADIMEFVDEEQNAEITSVLVEEPAATPSPMDLISKFIDENPAFTPNRLDLSEHREDISLGSIEEPEELATETLALIYTSQKLFEKAVTVYEKLILKFPEKSTYFASRIEDLRKNIK